MAYDRPSWREIDKMKDQPGRRKKRKKEKHEVQEHSTRYDKYKKDLNRLFDQGMAGELLKKMGKESSSTTTKAKTKSRVKEASRKGNGRIPQNIKATTSRLKLIRAVVDAENQVELETAIDELVAQFGLPDDWEVLGRVLEHRNETLILEAVNKMSDLLAGSIKIHRRFTLKERLRAISQTASDGQLRQLAQELEDRL